jgi:NAD(P)-dependent dehydrogenase (short-subunit alcohol dehydrogenase family)
MKHGIVLVTGATSGIGRAAALRLADAGFRVFAAGRRPDALVEVSARHASISSLPMDVTDNESVRIAQAHVDELTDGHGVDVLINSAGIARLGPAEVLPDEVLREQFETNVFGTMSVIRAFAPAMRARGSGRVINISSVLGRVTFPGTGVYAASKFAIESLSDALRLELAPFGVSVSVVEPGVVNTALTEEATSAAASYLPDLADYRAVMPTVIGLPGQLTRSAVTADVVADVVLRAVTDRRPAARYPVGLSARRAMWLLTRLPTRVSDRQKARIFGLAARAQTVAP